MCTGSLSCGRKWWRTVGDKAAALRRRTPDPGLGEPLELLDRLRLPIAARGGAACRSVGGDLWVALGSLATLDASRDAASAWPAGWSACRWPGYGPSRRRSVRTAPRRAPPVAIGGEWRRVYYTAGDPDGASPRPGDPVGTERAGLRLRATAHRHRGRNHGQLPGHAAGDQRDLGPPRSPVALRPSGAARSPVYAKKA
jgi:hypothetical protein